jgi:hypothetical protein
MSMISVVMFTEPLEIVNVKRPASGGVKLKEPIPFTSVAARVPETGLIPAYSGPE